MKSFEELLARLGREGPIRLTVTEEEYERLRWLVKGLWEGNQAWFAQTRLLFLAFLRGYTFYREVSENEDQFWANFLDELGVAQHTMTNKQYDHLETALKCHPDVRANFQVSQGQERTRREFVQTINAVWGVRRLGVAKLIELFLTFYQHQQGEEDFSDTLERLQQDGYAEAKHLLDAYNPVMTALLPVVQHIIERHLSVADPARLVQSLERAGLDLGRPNCVRFFTNKSEQSLPEIVRRLSGLPKVRKSDVPRTRLEARRELLRTDVRLRLLELSGINITEHDLEWRLSSSHILLEGQTQSGYLRLPDGRFSTFTWRPVRSPEGTPGKVPIVIQVDEVRAVAELECQPMAVRWMVRGKPLASTSSAQLEGLSAVLYSPYQRPEGWNLRFSVASEPLRFVDHPVQLRPLAFDTLLGEVCLNRRTGLWMPLSRLSLEITPRIDTLEVSDGVCRIIAGGPRQAVLTLTETEPLSGQQVVHQYAIQSEKLETIRVRHPQRLRPIVVRATLEASGKVSEKSVTAKPSWSLEQALVLGVGWSQNGPLSGKREVE